MNERNTVIDDVGDLTAKPGSQQWAVAVRLELQHFLHCAESDAEHLETYLGLIRKHKGWIKLKNDRGRLFTSYEAFCICKKPFGLGYFSQDIDRIIVERKNSQAQRLVNDETKPTLPKHGEIGKGRNRDGVAKSNGTTVEYLIRRMKRDAPEIAQALGRGEYRSTRDAAIAAGIVKVKTPLEQLKALWTKADAKQQRLFRKWIDEGNHDGRRLDQDA